MAKSSGFKVKFSIILIAVIVILAGIVITSAVAIVPAGCSGVVLTFGKASDNVMAEGLNFKVPFMQEVVIISNKIQKQEQEHGEKIYQYMAANNMYH